MNCSVCGALIPEGQDTCPVCGFRIQQAAQPMQPMGGYQQPMQPMGGYQQPMQPMGGYQQPMQPMGGYQQPVQPMGQPMGGYQQPMQPMGGYQQPMGQPMNAAPKAAPTFNKAGVAGILDGGIMKLVGLIGAALIMLSPLLSWCSVKLWGEKESINMFGIVDELDFGVFAFFGIMIILAGGLLLCLDIADLAQPLQVLKQKLSMIPYVELILVGVVLLFFILAMANGDLNDVIDTAELLDGKGSHGVGPVACFLGMLGAAAPRVCKILNINI